MAQTSDTDLTLEESVKQVMQTLPPFIREYLSEGKYTPVAQSLMAKYKLRIDQGGVLERELMLLLMGIETPDNFVQALINEARLDQQVVNGIVTDVNDQVFTPLRKQEEVQTKQAGMQPTPKPAPKPVVPMPPHIAPLPPKIAMPKSATLGDIVRKITAPAQLDNSRLLEDHEEPHIDIKASVSVPKAPATVVLKPMLTPEQATELKKDIPPMPPAPAQMPVSKPPVTLPPVLPTPKAPLPPPVTSYEVDPYREPIDEK